MIGIRTLREWKEVSAAEAVRVHLELACKGLRSDKLKLLQSRPSNKKNMKKMRTLTEKEGCSMMLRKDSHQEETTAANSKNNIETQRCN